MEAMLREAEKKLREAESRPVEVAIDETAVQRAVEEAKAAAAEEKKKAVATATAFFFFTLRPQA